MDAAGLRQRARALRDAMPAPERAGASLEIQKRLEGLDAFRSASQALFYWSFGSEVETLAMIRAAQARGLGAAAPRADPASKRLVFYLLEKNPRLEKGPFGILQPVEDDDLLADLEVPSAVVVPGLAFDAAGRRLGYGQGYYDRFLAGEGADLPKIALAFDCQVFDSVPAQAHDVLMDHILTPTRAFSRPSMAP